MRSSEQCTTCLMDMTIKSALLLFAGFFFFSSCHDVADTPAEVRAMWEARVKKVHVGMTRAEVEKLLPPYQAHTAEVPAQQAIVPYSSRVTTRTGSRQVDRYYVSPGWCVFVCYDYTGVTSENSQGAGGHRRPENKVLAPVILQYELEPEVKPATEKAR